MEGQSKNSIQTTILCKFKQFIDPFIYKLLIRMTELILNVNVIIASECISIFDVVNSSLLKFRDCYYHIDFKNVLHVSRTHSFLKYFFLRHQHPQVRFAF